MYVKPDYRGLGLGKALLETLIARAKDVQYIRLDSARFLTSAHNLFRAFGFQDIEPYVGSEVPEEYWPCLWNSSSDKNTPIGIIGYQGPSSVNVR